MQNMDHVKHNRSILSDDVLNVQVLRNKYSSYMSCMASLVRELLPCSSFQISKAGDNNTAASPEALGDIPGHENVRTQRARHTLTETYEQKQTCWPSRASRSSVLSSQAR
jgi:CRISPR/Cas system CMR-associated protein Cmr5 small subunit